MTLEMVRGALLWCLVINTVLLLSWWLMFTMAHDWIYRMHGRWFKLSMETFDAIHYAGMILFKLGIFAFNLVPYVALLITGWK